MRLAAYRADSDALFFFPPSMKNELADFSHPRLHFSCSPPFCFSAKKRLDQHNDRARTRATDTARDTVFSPIVLISVVPPGDVAPFKRSRFRG